MTIQKSFLARLFSRKPKQPALPLAIERSKHPYEPPAEIPASDKESTSGYKGRTPVEKLRSVVKLQLDFWQKCSSCDGGTEVIEAMRKLCIKVLEVTEPAKETPRKRVPYIATKDSPWAVIAYRQGKWVFESAHFTRWNARNAASVIKCVNVQARVVRVIVPTR
jgi:hypothetical protein